MKKYLMLALLLVVSATAGAMPMMLGHGDSDHGMSIGPAAKFTTFNGDFAVMAGGQIGWTLEHTFMLGAAAYGLVTEHEPNSVPLGFPLRPDQVDAEMSYGGIVFSYIGLSDQGLHPTFDLLIGGGEVDGDWNAYNWNDGNGYYYGHHHDGDGFFVLEPTVNAELNLARLLRADVGAGYRLVSGVNGWGLSDSDVGGPTASLILKLGKF